jgi:hypothetical protein
MMPFLSLLPATLPSVLTLSWLKLGSDFPVSYDRFDGGTWQSSGLA